MYSFAQVHDGEQFARFCNPVDLPPLDTAVVARQKADAHWMLTDHAGNVQARCSLWWRTVPFYRAHRLGIIGHYAVRDNEAGRQLLDLAADELVIEGCTLAIGPMDGNTWQRYRLITRQGSEPLFFLEPNNPPDWPTHFADNGFSVLARYTSGLNTDLGQPNSRLDKVAERAARRGISFRTLDSARFDTELRHIYHLVLRSFEHNLLYMPLDLPDFLNLYQPLRSYVQAELILIAEQAGQPLGFIFAIPDLLQAQRGQEIDTVIIKTVAVHPDHRFAGLGNLLVSQCQAAAHKLGYRRAIHALMHETNDSQKISRRYETETIRQYALFAKEL